MFAPNIKAVLLPYQQDRHFTQVVILKPGSRVNNERVIVFADSLADSSSPHDSKKLREMVQDLIREARKQLGLAALK